MEYLDALLMAGGVRFPVVAARLGATIAAGLPATRLAAPTELPLPTAEAAALAVADVLLGDLFGSLSEEAQGLLIRASVYRAPIGRDVLLLPVGQYSPAELGRLLDECRATGLLAADPAEDPPSVFVHRWTAFELHRRLADRQRGAEVTDAHRRAAEYWRWRISGWPHDHRAQSEASYHLLQVSKLSQHAPAEGHRRSRPRRRRWPFAAGALAMVAFLAAGASGAVFARPPATSSPVASARAQAAAWVAVQVGGDTIVACDPAMCAALLARGVPAGNMLILRSDASDPLGSDIVLATAAVRSQFGARLASVYAPQVIASFGSATQRIDVRAVAPDGAAAFRTELAADVAARRAAGRQLLGNSRISASAAARAALASGQPDARLLIMLAAMAAAGPVLIESFGDSGPHAGLGTPLRSAELAAAGPPAAAAARLRDMLAFVRAQRPPYLARWAGIGRGADGSPVLNVGFAVPSPVGLLQVRPAP